MIRYLKPVVVLAMMAAAAAIFLPRNGDAGPKAPDLLVVYTGDVIGNIEPCG